MNDNYLIPLFVAGTLLLSLFAAFLLSLLVLQKDKQNKYKTRLLQARLEEQEHTMDKISKEIHDNIGQLLGLVQMNVYRFEDIAKTEQEILVVKNTNDLIGHVITDLQNISHSLNGEYIKHHGLSNVLKKEVEYVNQSKDIACTINIVEGKTHLKPEDEIIIYRIAQEAIHNTIKHSKASELHIELQNDAAHFLLSIADDGIGFDMGIVHSLQGIGFENMHQRAISLDGKLKVESAPGNGCKITLTIINP